ncbi:hypothetical protein [Vibrio ziniensis]|uniref:Uncharacterized protein n=1 Tax=Vibrio ziniensis TaxID=2711221 RepID=A0A6G7CLP7_9VIBR|nr:hypothetical protein [Vibrio ziniensis]QIH43029.1 hypothetical protein G5S32_14215 [Vibrio ziniensis]
MQRILFTLLLNIVTTANVYADSTTAHCEIYQNSTEKPDRIIPCIFSQRQGHITINRSDGIVHALSPDENHAVGTFTDQFGKIVYRQRGLESQGLIFRFPKERVFVYWNIIENPK